MIRFILAVFCLVPSIAVCADFVAVTAKLRPAIVKISIPSGGGTGIIVDSRGLILTCAHVVPQRTAITVELADGRKLPAYGVARNAPLDLALISITAPNLSAATLADATPPAGTPVLLMGYPYGLNLMVASGVVGAVGATYGSMRNMVFHTAPVNPGDSGGPLVDAAGRVVAVVARSLSGEALSTLGAQGFGLAIPIDAARKMIQEAQP